MVPTGPGGQLQALYTGSYALLIGVSRYDNPAWPRLDSIPAELDQLADVLRKTGFNRVDLVLDPTGEDLRRAVQEFMRRYAYQAGTRLLFFFAGHGQTLDGGNRGYFVPRDAPDPAADESGFRSVALSMQQINTWADDIVGRHVLFAFDSCFSGTIFQSRDRTTAVPISELTAQPTRQFISAGKAGETVPARSTFTPAFARGIGGAADRNGDGYVTSTELGVFVQNELLALGRQTPQVGRAPDPKFANGDMVFLVPNSPAAKAQAPRPTDPTPSGSAVAANSDLVAESARRSLTSRGIPWSLSSVTSAMASGDIETLELFAKAKAEPGLFLEAMGGRTTDGRPIAQGFFERARRNPRAVDWLRTVLAGGLNPNATISGTTYKNEGLLNSAVRAGNAEAILALLEAGASPHAYQDLWLTRFENTRFVDPFGAILDHEGFTLDEKKRIVNAYLNAGALIPNEPVPERQTYQTQALVAVRAGLPAVLGIPLPPATGLRTQGSNLCRAFSRLDAGTDWCAFSQRMPVVVAAPNFHPSWSWTGTAVIGKAPGPYSDFHDLEILGMLNVVGDKAYFLAVERNSYGSPFGIVDVSRDGRIWRLMRYQRAGMGLCQKEADGYQPQYCWQRISMTYDETTRQMLVENFYTYHVWMGR